MPYSIYTKLTDERLAETDIRLLLASHSYIYPLGITEDLLIEIAEHVYPVDFIVMDIREDENKPFILGTPFLTIAKASIKFDTGTITLRSGKHKVIFDEKKLGKFLEISEEAQIDKGNASASVDKGKEPSTVEDVPAPIRKRGRPPSHVDGIRIYHKNHKGSERIANMKLKKPLQFDNYGTGRSTHDKAFDVDD
ncbi:reverse transcriptase domain-containing protein [Tanacetum coccineum]